MAANLSDNYEKLVLGLGVVVALGLGTMAYLNAGKLGDQFTTPTGSPKDAPPLPNEGQVDRAIANLGKSHGIGKGMVGDRKVDLYTGIPWFIKSESLEPVDLGNTNEADVHPPIPNSWWLEHNIDPGFADSTHRDEDGDGFTNGEEFAAKTDPTDFKSYGELVTKLELVKLVNERYRLEFSSEAGSTFKFKYFDAFSGKPRRLSSDYLPAGEGDKSIFFSEAPAMLKFRLLNVEERMEKNERTGIEMQKLYAMIEILTGSKKGDQFELLKGDKKHIISDYKVIMVLAAIDEGAKEIELRERESFSLPYDPDATEKPYKFKGVDENGGVIIEWQADGETKTRTITP